MDPISATIAVTHLLRAGMTAFQNVKGAAAAGPTNMDKISELLNTGMGLLSKAQEVSSLITKAQREKREITQEELDNIVAGDDQARAALVDAIARAEREKK